MEIVKFVDIKEEILSNLKRKTLLPILGSGFTRNCSSSNGKVPSGQDYRQHMIEQLIKNYDFNNYDAESLRKQSFSNVSDIYFELTSSENRKKYLYNNFTNVCIQENKKKFLSLDWPYVYTLNIDDGIEKNSNFNCIICSNRKVEEDIFNTEKCLIKLHGDVWEMIKYVDDKSEIFSKKQYIDSLASNISLLQRLKHDSLCQNLIYIGCSLDDELDLLSVHSSEENTSVVKRYICVTEEPTILQKVNLKKYGITHCIIFDSFNSIYDELYSLGIESQKVSNDELEKHKHFSFKKCIDNYEDNKSYLLHGKGLLDKHHEVIYPYFFISRSHTDKILKNIEKYTLQLLLGTRCSGKTYTLFDIVSRIKDRDTYLFETKDRLTEKAFKQILEKNNSVILFDNASLSISQIDYVIKNIRDLSLRNIKIIIVLNKSERDILGLLSLCIKKEIISEKDIPVIEISNKLDSIELDKINPLLTATNIGVFRETQNILDNILYTSEKLNEKNKYDTIIPKTETHKQLAALIALATERKIYSNRAIMFDLYDEFELQKRISNPLIEIETTWSFERNANDNSPYKYVLNAEFWICRLLSFFARDTYNCEKIVSAYRYIIEKIIQNDQGPNIHYVNKKGTYKEYILFDNINRIFNTGCSSSKEGLLIVKSIYDGLNSLLSVDPNYMHQRAKCCIRLSRFEKDYNKKMDYLNKASRDVNVSIQIFEQRYNESSNEQILISLAHLKYTQALIFCHKCNIDKYMNTGENSTAILLLSEALNSPFNSYEYVRKDIYNYDDVVSKIIYSSIANRELINEDAASCLSSLFQICSNNV